jgi:hypothetical protein
MSYLNKQGTQDKMQYGSTFNASICAYYNS